MLIGLGKSYRVMIAPAYPSAGGEGGAAEVEPTH